MLKKIRSLVREFRTRSEKISKQNDELIWANIFHDTIKDKEWLKGLSVSPGRWAADYSLLYVLVRILSDFKPKKIMEFGLGESSKIISSFLDHDLKNSKHLIIEQDENWARVFKKRFNLSPNCEILPLSLKLETVHGFPVNSYDHIEDKINEVFDLYLVDGPLGSTNFSRYDICKIARHLNKEHQFIIIIDDYNRDGEKETANELVSQLHEKEIKIYTSTYSGIKSQIIIATEKYRFVTTM
jgi:hypothetical protein